MHTTDVVLNQTQQLSNFYQNEQKYSDSVAGYSQ